MSARSAENALPIEYQILALFPMDEHGTGHIADCGFDANGERCHCYTLPERIREVLARPSVISPASTGGDQ